MQSYIDNSNGDVLVTVENVWFFKFLMRSKCAYVHLERKKICIIPAGFTCSKSATEVLEQGVKYVQS